MRMILVAAAVLAAASARAAEEEKITAEKYYASKCASCHGKDGKGSEKMAKMLKVDAKELDLVSSDDSDEEFLKATLEGKGKKMPAYKDKLKGLDPKELLAYVKTLRPKKDKAK